MFHVGSGVCTPNTGEGPNLYSLLGVFLVSVFACWTKNNDIPFTAKDTKTSRGFTDICCLQPSFLSGGIRATGAHRRRAEAAKAPATENPKRIEKVHPDYICILSDIYNYTTDNYTTD